MMDDLPPGFTIVDAPAAPPAPPAAFDDLPPGFAVQPAPRGPTEGQSVVSAVKNIATNALAPLVTPTAAPGTPELSRAPAGPSGDGIIRAIMDKTGAVIGQNLHGIREGMLNFAGMPVDAANNLPRLANIIPGVNVNPRFSERPFGGGDSLNGMVDSVIESGGYKQPAPADAIERFSRRVGNEQGAAFVPAGAALRAGQVGAAAVRQMGPLAQLFLEKAAVSPVKYAGGESVAATIAGAGAGGANEISRAMGHEPGPVVDTVGAVGGLGAAGVANVGGRAVKQLYDAIWQRPGYVDDVVKQTVTGQLANAMDAQPGPKGVVNTDPLVAQIMGGKKVDDVIPGFKESLADRTGNANIANLEYGRMAKSDTGAFASRRAENSTAIDNALNRSAPAEGASTGALREELVRERARLQAEADARTVAAATASDQALAPVTPQNTRAVNGDTIRNGIEDAQAAAQSRTQAAYENADVNRTPVQPAPLTESLDNVTAGLTEAERGLVPQGLIDRVSALGREAPGGPQPTGILGPDGAPITRAPAPPDPVRAKEAMDLRSELQRQQRAALADPNAEKGGRNTARVLGQYIDQVDNFLDGALPAPQRQALQDARQAKFDEAEAFTRAGDPVAQAVARHEGGLPKVRDDRVGDLFVNPQSMDRLFNQADTPAVRNAMRDEVLHKGDTSSPQRIRNFMDTHAEQMQRFPGLRDEMEAAARAREAHGAATTDQARLTKELGTETDRGSSIVGQHLHYGPEKAAQAMDTVFGHPKPGQAIDELLNFTNNSPAAVEGAKKAFWDKMNNEARSSGSTTADVNGRQPWLRGSLKAFLDDPAKAAVAERIYRDNPEHLDNIRKVADALQGVDTRNAAKAPNTSGTSQGSNPAMSAESLASRYYAYARGQVGAAYLATSIASQIARRKIAGAREGAIGRLLDEALLNPDVAAQLLKENNPANRAALARKSQTWKAEHISDFLRGDDQHDDTTKAIMGK